MDTEIFKDPIYKQFFAALNYMLKTEWKRKQTVLGQKANISKGYMADIVKGSKKASFKKRDNIAKACGYSYESFIDLGKVIFGDEQSKNINVFEFKDELEREFFDIIRKFKNSEKAKSFNEYLFGIESIQKEAFDDLYREAKATYKALKRLEKKQDQEEKNNKAG